MTIIRLNEINKHYGKDQAKIYALKNISLSIEAGEMIAIVGKSGSGKSTLLNIIGGLDIPNSGQYLFEGKEISGLKPNALAEFRRQNIGFIVQHFALIDDMTIFDNVALPLRYNRLSSTKIKEVVKEILEKMEISDKMNLYPPQLSGGQCQRVAIARALACNPVVLLADEPTGALDEKTSLHILEIFKKLNEQGITIIIATHDKDIANSCKKIIQLNDGMQNNEILLHNHLS
ncbi:ABC transporter ATP-binding protein [Alkaliphilus crotonatoxidans]